MAEGCPDSPLLGLVEYGDEGSQGSFGDGIAALFGARQEENRLLDVGASSAWFIIWAADHSRSARTARSRSVAESNASTITQRVPITDADIPRRLILAEASFSTT